jgi:Fic family protein
MSVVSEGNERGHEKRIDWNGHPVNAWIPRPVADQDLSTSTATARQTEQAIAAIRGSGQLSGRFESVALLLERAEGVASTWVEGLRVPLVEVAAAEIGETRDRSAMQIADNQSVVRHALAAPEQDLQIADLHQWQRQLMGSSALPGAMIGRFRMTQSWVGGTSPRDAALVPPPPDLVEPLMADLVAFANSEQSDPVTQAAVAHAQFETIHPYADGNGRIGRILVGWILARRLGITRPPPVSVFIAQDQGGYLAGLTLFRMGHLDNWVMWMSSVLLLAGDAATSVMTRSEELLNEWNGRIADLREDATARNVLDLLGEHPVVSSELLVTRLGVSSRAALNALQALASAGIVQPYEKTPLRPGRPRHYWVAGELLNLISGWPGS